jgi:two-component system, chemotaxis family, response regulator PixG
VNINDIEEIEQPNLEFRDLIIQFKTIKAKGLSGNLVVHIESEPTWMFSFNRGALGWISGGIDPINRWQRNLAIANFKLAANLSTTNLSTANLSTKSDDPDRISLNPNSLAQQTVVVEVLFDIIQISQSTKNQLSYQFLAIDPTQIKLIPNLPLLNISSVLSQAIEAWQEWLQLGLADFCPSQFLTIERSILRSSGFKLIDNLPEILASIDGARSLRSLAIYHRQSLQNFTKSILPLLRSGTITFSSFPSSLIDHSEDLNISDFLAEIMQAQVSKPAKPLIACIDDSISVYMQLEKLLTEQGYRSYGIQDPLKIISTLIKHKPKLIFLDLLMPVANGYEVCEQIRKTSSLKDVPVIILTAKDGLFDRMRAKVVGANDFLSKPIAHADVLRVLGKYVV